MALSVIIIELQVVGGEGRYKYNYLQTGLSYTLSRVLGKGKKIKHNEYPALVKI